MYRSIFGLAALIALAGCEGEAGDGVGGVSASEAHALNEAAALLDGRAETAENSSAGLNPAATAAAGADRNRTAPK